MKLALLIAAAMIVALSTPAAAADSRAEVLAVDEQQRAYVAASDVGRSGKAGAFRLAHQCARRPDP